VSARFLPIRILFPVFLAVFLHASSAAAAPECPELFKDDPQLFERLPERIQKIFSRGNASYGYLRDPRGWKKYQASLDHAITQADSKFELNVRGLHVRVRLRKKRGGRVLIEFPSVQHYGISYGENARSGVAFVQLIGATLDWLARNRIERGIREIEIRGGMVVNERLIEILRDLGFRKRIDLACATPVFLGTLAGFSTGTVGKLMIADFEEEDSHWGDAVPVAGAVVGFATPVYFACVKPSSAKDYRLILRPRD
jgi:hypothetical protein